MDRLSEVTVVPGLKALLDRPGAAHRRLAGPNLRTSPRDFQRSYCSRQTGRASAHRRLLFRFHPFPLPDSDFSIHSQLSAHPRPDRLSVLAAASPAHRCPPVVRTVELTPAVFKNTDSPERQHPVLF